MSVAFKLKRSSISGRAPDTGSLDYGELAVNTFDGILYLKKNDGNGDTVIPIQQYTEYNFPIDNSGITNSASNNLSGVLRDLDRSINQNKSFEIGADDSTIRTVNPGESVSFLGSDGVTTASDAEGNITISGPDLTNYVQLTGSTFTGQVSFNGTGNSVLISDTLRIAGTGSGLRMTGVGAFDNNNGDFRVFGSNGLQLLASGSDGSGIEIAESGAVTFNNQFTFPTADGSNGQVLVTDGSGSVSWQTISSGGGSSVASLYDLTNVSVDTNTLAEGDVLQWNGTNWVAGTATVGGTLDGGDADQTYGDSGITTGSTSSSADEDHILWNLALG